MPTVDVVLPYFEGQRFVAGALASLEKVAGEVHLRVIVVDDGSTSSAHGELRTALSSCGLEWELLVNDSNLGIGATRQRGLDAVEAEVVGFLDQDDRWCRAMLGLLPELDHADYVSGRIQMCLVQGLERPSWCRAEWLEETLPGNVVAAGLFRTDVLREVGGFTTAFRLGVDDVDLFARLRRRGIAQVVSNEVVLERLVHETNASGNPAAQRELLAGIHAHLKGTT
jgi:glycosyltransferase involved in cell wall biosynthesis